MSIFRILVLFGILVGRPGPTAVLFSASCTPGSGPVTGYVMGVTPHPSLGASGRSGCGVTSHRPDRWRVGYRQDGEGLADVEGCGRCLLAFRILVLVLGDTQPTHHTDTAAPFVLRQV